MKRQATLPFQAQNPSASHDIGQREEDSLRKRARMAEHLGVPWPPSKAVRRRGRPTRPEAWVSALQGAIHREDWSELSALPSNAAQQVPVWFSGGSRISMPGMDNEAVRLADATLTEVRAGAASQTEPLPVSPREEEEEKEEVPAVRPKSVISWETKRWFVAWSSAMQKQHKWTVSSSWRAAQSWLHEALSHTNEHTHRRWPAQIREHDERKRATVPASTSKASKIPGHVIMRMTTAILDLVAKGTALSTDTASHFLEEICAQEGHKFTFSREWTRPLSWGVGVELEDERSKVTGCSCRHSCSGS